MNRKRRKVNHNGYGGIDRIWYAGVEWWGSNIKKKILIGLCMYFMEESCVVVV